MPYGRFFPDRREASRLQGGVGGRRGRRGADVRGQPARPEEHGQAAKAVNERQEDDLTQRKFFFPKTETWSLVR